MDKISRPKSTILFGENAYSTLNKYLTKNNFSKVFVLCDENTQKHCIPLFFQQLNSSFETELIEVESGEIHKDIATCQQLWATLSDLEGDRDSVLINLGGGIITDMGGFVASTFLRGIPFINVPTTLLAMVDAAIGGKTGVNRKGLKNQVGVFKHAELTVIDIKYLRTLPQNQFKSGLAEMLKHGLIIHKDYWEKLSDLKQLTLADLETLINDSITIKTNITTKDNREKGLRKILNFGHTLGHAIESYFLEQVEKPTLLHGEAIAIGMILESYLSSKVCGLPKTELSTIKKVILHTFNKVDFTDTDIEVILKLLQYDKKNSHGKINFVLLERIGAAKIDQHVPKELIVEAFGFYAMD